MQRTFLMWLGIALASGLAASGARAGSISLDDIRSDDTFVSGNGKLEFSDFDSSGHVDEDDIFLEILEDGVRISGREGVSDDGKQSFEVSYTVTALDPTMPISGATLELESIVSGDPFAGVLATKKLLARDRDSDWSDSGSAWYESSRSRSSSRDWDDDDRDDDDRDDDDHKGYSKGRGKGHDKDNGKGHEKSRGKGHSKHHDDDDDDDDDDHDKPDRPDREDALAILKAYDIQVGLGCHDDDDDCSLNGQNLFDETEFDEPVDWIRVVDGVKIFSLGDGDADWVSSTNRFPVVPEPSTAGLLGIGLLALAASRRRSATRE